MEGKKKHFVIRKGLESPLCIQGMEMKYFYIFSFIAGGMILLLVGNLLNLSQNINFSNFASFLTQLIICFVILIALKIYFSGKSNNKKYKFKKTRIYLTNRNIFDLL